MTNLQELLTAGLGASPAVPVFCSSWPTTASTPTTSIWDYSNPDDFTSLWNTAGSASGRIIVIWTEDKVAHALGPVKLDTFLTPIHWALAASRNSSSALAVTILDIREEPAPETSFSFLNPALFGWLRVLRGKDLIDSWSISADHPPIEANLRAPSTDLLRRAIAEEIRSEDFRERRHAFANVAVPLILLPNFRAGDQHAEALRLLLQVTFPDLVSSLGAHRTITLVPERSKLFQSRRLVLVDDMADRGWHDWLEQTISGACGMPLKVEAFTDPKVLLNAQGGDPDVLFLDLRLFENLADERQFLASLIRVWRRVPKHKQWECIWLESAIERAESWGSALSNSDEGAEERRTLVVALIAQLDSTRPIIVFSSSTNGDVVRKLQSFGNVITLFSKPALFGPDASVSLEDAGIRLGNSLAEACKWLATRDRLRSIRAVPAPAAAPTPLAQSDTLYVELFVDESGILHQPPDRVAGLLALFVGSDPLSDADEFDDLAVESGVRYFAEKAVGPAPPAVLTKDKDSGLNEFLAAREKFEKRGKSLKTGFLQVSSNRAETPGSKDERYWSLVDGLIEAFMSETLPRIAREYGVPEDRLMFSVYVGTRVRPLQAIGRRTYSEGFHIAGKNYHLVVTFDHRDVYWAVQRASRQHPHSFKAIRTVGVRLAYANGGYAKADSIRVAQSTLVSEDRLDTAQKVTDLIANQCLSNQVDLQDARYDYRALHYVADSAMKFRGAWGWEPVPSLGQFRDELDSRFERALTAARWLDSGDLVRAIEAVGPKPRCSGLTTLVSARIADRLDELSACDVERLANLLSA